MVLAAERLGESFNAASEKLRYTPRELTVHPDLRTIAIVEADQSCVPFARREAEGPAGEQASGRAGAGESRADAMDADDADADSEDESALTPAEQFGAPKAPGAWASCVRAWWIRVCPPGTRRSRSSSSTRTKPRCARVTRNAPRPTSCSWWSGPWSGSPSRRAIARRVPLAVQIRRRRRNRFDAQDARRRVSRRGVRVQGPAARRRRLCAARVRVRQEEALRKAECGGFPNFVTTVPPPATARTSATSPRAFSLFGTTRATVQCSSPPTTLARGT